MIKIKTSSLNVVLDTNVKCVGTTKIQPILATILINVKESKCRFTTSDGVAEVTTFLMAEADEDISICVDAKTFISTIKLVDAEDVVLTIKGKTLMIKAGRSAYKIPTFPGKDFIRIKPSDEIKLSTLPPEIISSITKASSYINPNDSRPTLTGVSIRRFENKAIVQATDAFSFYSNSFTCEEDFKDCIINYSIVNLIDSFKASPEIKFGSDDKVATFKDNNTTINVRLIDGAYPKTDQFIGMKKGNYMIIERQSIIRAVKRAMIYAKMSSKQIVIKTDVENKTIKIISEDADVSKASNEVLEPEVFNLEEIVIGLNYSFFLNTLNTIESSHVRIYINKPNEMVFVVDGDDCFDEVTFVLPMMVENN